MDRIEGAIGLPDVPALAAKLRDWLQQGDVTLDLTHLTGIDTAAVQLLLSARIEADACGRSLAVHMPQDGPVPALIAQLGLEFAFDPAGRTNRPEQGITI